RGGVERVIGVDEVLDGARRRLVHHLETGGNDAGGDDGTHRRARLLEVVERGERHARALRLGQELDGDLGDYREQPFAAGDEREEIVTSAVERVAAELDDLAVDEHG